MTARARFLFDNDFALGDTRSDSPARHQTGMAEAEARGYRNGVVAGKAEAASEVQRQTAVGLARAAEGLEALARGLAAVEARMQTEAVEVAVAIARKLAPALVAREPLAEIAALAADCFRHLVNAPHVVLRVNDALFEPLRT